MRLIHLILLGILLTICQAGDEGNDTESDTSRKILGSSVVTSVSVIMDTGNKKNTIFTDAVGKPQSKPSNPSELASPIDLLNPDRYEFYTFDDNGDLVKRLMSLEEIKSIIATGDNEDFDLDSFTSQGFLPEKRVSDVVNNVQNVLKEEMEILKDPIAKPIFDTPDVSDSWSMILPAVFGNSGEDIKPEKPVVAVTPDTFLVEPATTTKKPLMVTPIYYSSTSLTSAAPKPSLDVEIISNSGSNNYEKTTTTETPTRPPIVHSTPPPFIRDSTTSKATAKPNIFGLPPHMDPDHLSDYRRTTSLPRPSTLAGSNIFGFPTKTDDKIVESKPVTNILGFPESSEQSSTLKVTKKPSGVVTLGVPAPTEEIMTTHSSQSTISGYQEQMSSKEPLFTLMGLTKSPGLVTTPEATGFTQIMTSRPSKRPASSSFTSSITTSRPSQGPTTSTASFTSSPEASTTTVRPSKRPATLSSSFTASSEASLSTTFGPSRRPATSGSSSFTSSLVSTTSAPTKRPATSSFSSPSTVFTSETSSLAPSVPSSTLSGSAVSKISVSPHLGTSSVVLSEATTSKPSTWVPTAEDSQLFSIFKEVLSQGVTTEKIRRTTVTDRVTTLPPILNSLSENQKLSASELLDQLLLTTNIYEINTELAKQNFTGEALTTTTESERDSYSPTTDITLIQSIEQLLSQAVGDVQAIVNLTTEQPPLGKESEPLEADITTSNTDIDLISTTLNDETTSSQVDMDENYLNTETTVVPTTTESATVYYVIRREPSTAATNLINATLVSKPAKADLTLEQEVLAEELKQFTATDQNITPTEPLPEKTETVEVVLNSTTESATEVTTQEELTTVQEETTTATTETLLPSTDTEENLIIQSTTKAETIKNGPRPSIVINVNPNGTIVTENGKLVANKTTTNSTQQDHAWTLVSTVAPQQNPPPSTQQYPVEKPAAPVDLVPKPMQGFGLEDTTSTLDVDVHQFIQLCNELAFGFWKTVTTGLSSARSIFVSPFAATSMLAMVFLGAKGATSEEMNEILKLDDMVTFNPHLTFKGVSESIVAEPKSGVATTVMIRELFSDRSKGKLLDFYKNRVKAFYDGYVEEVSYREIGDVIRRRSNLLVKKYSGGKYQQFIKDSLVVARAPLSGVAINIFETDCSETSREGRDGEMHFIVYPSIKQRRLVPIPAVVYKTGFLAGYEPSLDATAVAVGHKDQTVSTIFVVPGQQGISSSGDGLIRLEKRLVESSFKKGAWSRLLRSLIPRPGLEVQIPRFSHRSVINATTTLQRMGLHELFNPDSADLRGLNGVANELHLADVLQINKFTTCGDVKGDDAHHSEVYPATTMRARSSRRLRFPSSDQSEEPRDYQRAFHDPLHDPTLLDLPLSLRPRQARIPEVPRLRFDRPFLYFVRHNPTGLILHMGRFNPRLLP
ncbi:mucin-5AC [Anthonomus grandis grandis]|uniref:mucin-5AC n=1 Tax=Anthonomus grandis grandis TaxID=2921223 RepID=UPI002165C4B6|nr:mucin-5AC [Anthonomus grandis grandis]XP_050296872.1 mucin-5AC [Anthonomus grandis grandis]